MMMTEKQMRARRQAQARAAKRRRVMRNRMILAAVVIAIISAITVGVVSHVNKANAAANEESVYIPEHDGLYMSYHHTVKGGESLGTIAANYIQQYGSDEDVDTVVNRIINKNGLDRTEATYHLQAGQELTVSLWIAEDRNPHHSDPSYNCLEESQN